jgi:hypothetical protein
MWSGSDSRRWKRPAAGSSKNSTVTAATRHDPLYRIRNAVRAGADKLTARQIERIEVELQAGDPHFEVTVAWRCYQQRRSAFTAASLPEGRAIATKVLESFPTCSLAEIARLGRTLRAWRDQFLAYFTTGRASNGGTGSDQRHHRTSPTHRSRFPQPRQLPTTDDPGRRTPHPPESPMSRISGVGIRSQTQGQLCKRSGLAAVAA